MSRISFAVVLIVLLASACAWAQAPPAPTPAPAAGRTPQTPPTTPAATGVPAAAAFGQPLLPGDTISVTVAGEPTVTGTYTVREDGRVIFPLTGALQVSGLTSMQLADRLSDLLRQYVVEPVVAVTVTAAMPRQVAALGDFLRPGTYELRQAPTLQALLTLTGGPTPGADPAEAVLVRGGEIRKLAGVRELTLEPGDVITIPSRGVATVSVAGAVKTPGPLSLANCGSAARALMMAGGPAPEADSAGAYLLRGDQRLPLHLASFLSGDGGAEDVALQPGDVLMVPQKTESSVYVLGEVKTVGAQVLSRPLRLTTALTQAGGLTDTADPARAYVLRGNEKLACNLHALLQEGEGQEDLVLTAGDVLVVPRNNAFIYLLGQVLKPGPQPLGTAGTVMAAWSLSGGGTPEADLRHALLLRGDQSTPIDLEALERGDTHQDQPLQEGDRLLVPRCTHTMYVLGQVTRPGIYCLQEGDTLIDVIARAGGPTALAAVNAIAVVRRTPPGTQPVVECPPGARTPSELSARRLERAVGCGLNVQFLDLARVQEGRQVYLARDHDLVYLPAMSARRIDWLQVLIGLGTALAVAN